MVSYKDLLHQTFKNEFNIDRFSNFIVQFFNNSKIIDTKTKRQDYWNWNEYSYYINGFYHIAEYIDPNRNKIAIFAVELKKGKSLEKARSKQRNFIADRIKNMGYDGAITAFYSEDENETKWRLSFVRLDFEFLKGKVKSNLTPARRYSYLVGKGEPCHTAMQQLLPILEEEKFNPTLDKIEEAFSVEGVTKQFFEKYREKYFEIKDYLMSNTIFTEEAERCIKSNNSGDVEKFAEQFAKKLMGQIAFMYFLQKKGWLGVNAIAQTITESQYKNLYFYSVLTRKFADQLYVKIDDNEYKLVPSVLNKLNEDEEIAVASSVKGQSWGTGPKDFVRKLFDVAVKSNKNYFNDYLEPLFYEALNEKRPANNYFAKLHCRIPFLNGGLFEPYYDYKHTNFQIPNEIFSNKSQKKDERDADGILDIFDRYNFTINEDEPLEKEVAVDPEMLGKIFENLLDAKDRKSKGAYYTPREIVHYMCQESLINYLVNTVNTPYEDTKDFILYGEIMKDEDCSREVKQGIANMLISESIYSKLNEIDNALADVRVADPAVGSGAFPMGMVNEIVKARDIITEYRARQIEIDGKKQGISDQQINFLKAKEHNDRNLYNLKRDAMFNSIYAVDIEPSAVDIAKLRLWLSLVVEFEVSADDPNPPTLPNLDCHILCGNSLIDEFEGIKLFDETILKGGGDLISSLYEKTFDKLYIAERNFFYAQNHEDKYRFKEEIEDLKLSIMESALTGTATNDIKTRFLQTRNLASTPYILWQLEFSKVFRDKGGFDIVIGNPPYVGESGNKELFRNISCTSFGDKYYQGKMDFWYFFTCRGIDLLRYNGIISFIAPNKWTTNSGASIMRNKILNETEIKRYIDFNDYMIFSTASIQTMIFVLKKHTTTKSEFCFTKIFDKENLTNDLISSILNAYDYDFSKSIYITFNHKENINKTFNFSDKKTSSIIDKISGFNNKIYLYKDEIAQGIVIPQESLNAKNKEILGDSFTVGEGIFVLTKNELELLKLSDIEKKIIKPFYTTAELVKYYAKKENDKYLIYTNKDINSRINNYPNIKKHLDRFQNIITSDNKPYGLHRPRNEEFFNGEKIISTRKCCEPTFTYFDGPSYCLQTFNIIKTNRVSLKYLTGILNSKIIKYWLKNKGKMQGENYQIDKEPILEIPIPILNKSNEQIIVEQVNNIFNESNVNDSIKEIDLLLYKLYGFTPDEVKIIEEGYNG